MSSEMLLPPESPVINSKITVSNIHTMPVSHFPVRVLFFISRGYISHVIRKIRPLKMIPLAGKAHFCPKAGANIYSLSPPLRIAAGMKHIQIIRDFRIFIGRQFIFYPALSR